MWRITVGILVLLLTATVAAAGPPFIRTNSIRHNWDVKTCLANVKSVMENMGFTNLDVDNNDVEGPKGEYMAEVICWKRAVFAIVAGPRNRAAGGLRDDILKGLKNLR
ncbi:MAG: hypothetical protein OXU75_22035 [Deltaproteobacteria bacterium]|nr:hypothetical protein [Deltaproteobacteria bacterium]